MNKGKGIRISDTEGGMRTPPSQLPLPPPPPPKKAMKTVARVVTSPLPPKPKKTVAMVVPLPPPPKPHYHPYSPMQVNPRARRTVDFLSMMEAGSSARVQVVRENPPDKATLAEWGASLKLGDGRRPYVDLTLKL